MRKTALIAVGFFSLTLAQCGHDHGGTSDVIYQGQSSDEAYTVMVDAEARVMLDAAKGPLVTVPGEGQAYQPSAAPPPFRWSSPLSASLSPRRQVRPAPAAPSLADLLSPGERAALAHQPPVTGPIYVLRFAIPGESPVTVVTSELDYTPDGATWSSIKKTTGRIQLEITGAYLRSNVIEEGPYRQPTPRTFTIAASFW